MIRKRLVRPCGIAATAVIAGVLYVVTPEVMAVVLSILASVGFLVALHCVVLERGYSGKRRASRWSGISFCLHLVLSVMISAFPSAVLYFGADALGYDLLAKGIAQHWLDHTYQFPALPAGKEGFYLMLGALYTVLGPVTVVGLVVNAALSAGLVPLVMDTTRRMCGVDASLRVAPLVVLLPSLLIFTSQLLREPGILFLVAISSNAAVRLGTKWREGSSLALVASLALLFTFRANVALVLTVAALVGLLVSRGNVASGILVSTAGAILVGVLVVGVGIGNSGYQLTTGADLEQVANVRTGLSESASGFSSSADISSFGRLVRFVPVSFAQFALGPFPWQIRSARQLPVLVDVAALWCLLPSTVRGVRLARQNAGRQTWLLLIPALALTFMLSLFIGNFGTLVRARSQVTLLLLPFVALGLSRSSGIARQLLGSSGQVRQCRHVGALK